MMPLWKVFPGPHGVYEQDFLDNGHVGISYGFAHDLRTIPSRAALHEIHAEGFQQLWRFYDELEIGALVVVPSTDSSAHIGEIGGSYEFREEPDPYHLRPIRWLSANVPDREFGEDIVKSVRSPQAVHRVQVAGADGHVRDLAWSGIDKWLSQAQKHVDSGHLDSEEMEYKRAMIDGLARARSALLSGREEWRTLIQKALAVQGSPLPWRSAQAIYRWFASDPQNAMSAMDAFWSEGDGTDAERIQALIEAVPEGHGFKKSAVGTTLRAVSALYMALGPDHPPFASTAFESAYRATRFPSPPNSANQGEVYQHALGFLDRVVGRASTLGFQRPTDRLEAQSLVWMMSQEIQQEDESDEDELASKQYVPDLYTLADELLLPVSFLQNIERLLTDKRQVIFQGPPGTGKTYVAKQLAECLAGSPDRVRLVQFHPSYAYEDFIQGYRPSLDESGRASFTLRNGPLVEMAELANAGPDRSHFLVIDEINRGNLAKVLGELYFLLEYRSEAIRLQYSDALFALPRNLYIIGTMNTADRSIALVDLALRRRFHFVDFHPQRPPIDALLTKWLSVNAPDMQWVARVVDHANVLLDNSEAAIGSSYFMKQSLDDAQMELLWKHNVLPYIEEQFYGDPDRLAEFDLQTLRNALNFGDKRGDHPQEPSENNEDR